MVNEEYEKKIRDWLERSGYDLELRVARAAGRTGATVLQSVIYDDLQEDKRRETDVVVSFVVDIEPFSAVHLVLVVECKRGTGQTWIAFTDAQPYLPPLIQDQALVTETSMNPRLLKAIKNRWGDSAPLDNMTPVARTIVAADLGGSKRENGANLASDAVRQSLSAAVALQDISSSPQITIPIVVTGSQIFECKLGANDDTELGQVDYVRVQLWWPPNEGREIFAHVMSLERFERLAQEMDAITERISYEMEEIDDIEIREQDRMERVRRSPRTSQARQPF